MISFSGLFVRLHLLPYNLYDGGQQGDEYDGHDEYLQVVLHERQVAEEISGVAEERHPESPARHVVEHEVIVMHLPHAGHEGGECPYDGDEPGDDDGLASVFLVELMGLVQVALLENLGIGVVEQLLAEEMADHIVAGVAQHRRSEQRQRQKVNIQGHAWQGGYRSGDEKHGIAGKERRDHQSGLAENNQEQNRISPRVIFLDDLDQMLVDM